MIQVVEYLLEDFQKHAPTCELEVCHDNKLCKIKRMEYLPDENGMIIFRKEDKWVNDGYSISEATEMITKYAESIKGILFEAVDGSFQEYVNSVEVEEGKSGTIFRLRIIVGEDIPMTFSDNMAMGDRLPITLL